MSYAQEKVALTSIVLVWRILPSSFVMYNDTLEKFSFVNLKKWKTNMVFYLTTLNMVKFLT